MKIFLIGMPGSGKTSVGRALAPLVGADFVDVDLEIEAREGLSIPEIFASTGEQRFREVEADVIAGLCASRDRDLVVATGGGAPLHAASRRRLRGAGHVVYLDVDLDTLETRTGRSGRPLLDGAKDRRSALERLAAERVPVYERCAHEHVVAGRDRARDVAARIALQRGAARVTVPLKERAYPVFVGTGTLAQLGERLRKHSDASQCVVVTDSNVGPLYGSKTRRTLRSAGFQVTELTIPAGERSKSAKQLGRLYDGFAAAGADRRTPVVALGGGVVGDLAGLAAGTWLRGVPCVQVPTTLLAQVDSAIGGKVAINHSSGKNRIGAFHQPLFVLADVALLDTLPARELLGGLGETLKYGAAMDRALFRRLCAGAEALQAAEPDDIAPVVLRCAGLKARVVGRDEQDRKGIRAVLNAGHTIGHALEAATGFRKWRHGEAVAAGLVLESRLAAEEGICSAAVVEQVADAVATLGLPGAVRARGAASYLGADKKRVGTHLAAPLLAAVGKTRLVELPVRRWRQFVRREVE